MYSGYVLYHWFRVFVFMTGPLQLQRYRATYLTDDISCAISPLKKGKILAFSIPIMFYKAFTNIYTQTTLRKAFALLPPIYSFK